MTHRILLTGRDQTTLDRLTEPLRRAGYATLAGEPGPQAGNLARQLRPTVAVLVAPNDPPTALGDLGLLATHPATTNLPLVAITRPLSRDDAIAAFQRGVAGLVYAAEPQQIIQRLDAVLGAGLDVSRRAAAVDRRGPAVLRRIATYIRGMHATGELHIDAGGEEAVLPVSDGVLGAVRYGDLRGPGALQALIHHPEAVSWTFTFKDPGAARPKAAPPDEDDGDESLDIDIDLDGDEPAEAPLDHIEPLEGLEGTHRLLLADDDPALLQMYRRFLQRAGFEVLTADNGRAGLEVALQERPDVIVSDIMMPEVDGWGFLTNVRQDHRLRDVRFLLLSCHSDYIEKLRELDAGAEDYLEKGMRADEIVGRVTEAIDGRRRARAAIAAKEGFTGDLGRLGATWLLDALSKGGASGRLVLGDGVGEVIVSLKDGSIVDAIAKRPGGDLKDREALLVLLAAEAAPIRFEIGAPVEGDGERFAAMRDDLCEELNRADADARARLFEDGARLAFHEATLSFYRSVCPDVVRDVLDELEAGATPKQCMEVEGRNPALVDWVVNDLLRKRVARLADADDAAA